MDRQGIPPPRTDVCSLADLAEGEAKVVSFGRGWGAFELIVVRDQNGVRGYVNVCPHNPLPLNIGSRIYTQDEAVHCDHHYAVFRFSDGMCTAGMCQGQALTPVPLEISAERIIISEVCAQ